MPHKNGATENINFFSFCENDQSCYYNLQSVASGRGQSYLKVLSQSDFRGYFEGWKSRTGRSVASGGNFFKKGQRGEKKISFIMYFIQQFWHFDLIKQFTHSRHQQMTFDIYKYNLISVLQSPLMRRQIICLRTKKNYRIAT